MEIVFYLSGAVAVIATALMLKQLNIVHALLYLIVSLLAVAVVFYTLGAPFVAALEAIVYAGAIMVLFLFAVMMLNLGRHGIQIERQRLTPGIWTGPSVLSVILIAEVFYITRHVNVGASVAVVGPREVGIALYGPYVIGAELASMLLLAGIVGAFHLGYREPQKREIRYATDTGEGRVAAGGDLVLAGTDEPARTA